MLKITNPALVAVVLTARPAASRYHGGLVESILRVEASLLMWLLCIR